MRDSRDSVEEQLEVAVEALRQAYGLTLEELVNGRSGPDGFARRRGLLAEAGAFLGQLLMGPQEPQRTEHAEAQVRLPPAVSPARAGDRAAREAPRPASPVLQMLSSSSDPVEFELAEVLMHWQAAKAAAGRPRTLGYEPRTILRLGAVATIARRVTAGARGFDEVDPHTSHEAIVGRHPDRFPEDVVRIARARLLRRDG